MKSANIIVVGGSIAAGKSALVGSLGLPAVPELDPNDELQKVLLDNLYKGDKIAAQVFQLDIMLSRFDKYKKLSASKETYVFDRMIFEDKLFAYLLFGGNNNVWHYYNSIWEDKVDEIINEIGKPKLYILLSINWKTSTKRIFKRNRYAEVSNFERNELYFKKLLDKYDSFVIDLLEKYDIPYYVVDTNDKNTYEVIQIVKAELLKRGII